MLLKVMTFNLRVDVPADGINAFSNRTEKIRRMLLSESPDIIGTQEVNESMLTWAQQALCEKYISVGTGRQKDFSGEGARILYDFKKFALLRLETKWLSETPDVPESRYSVDQSDCPRVYTLAEFVERNTRTVFRVINVHLDHKGEAAMLCGAVQIMQRIAAENASFPMKTVLTGDFNALPDSPAVKTVRAHLSDLTENLAGTFHDFGRLSPQDRTKIDYIFSDAPAAKNAYIVPDEPSDGVYVSDHFPVCAFLCL